MKLDFTSFQNPQVPKNYMDILLYRGNSGNTELFNQHFGDIGTKEAGKSRSQMDVLDA